MDKKQCLILAGVGFVSAMVVAVMGHVVPRVVNSVLQVEEG